MLPDTEGIEIARQMAAKNSMIPIIILSAHGTVSRAVEATRLGVYDFLEKPPDRDRILMTIRNALAQRELKQELERYKQECLSRYRMIGQSPAMKQVYQLIEQVASSRSPVLILGENGVGKELVAQAIHDASLHANKQMMKINCAAIPDDLLECELFGHTKGAFTGAHLAKKGRIQMADGSTLFLDEIGDLSPSSQSKMLRFLESGEIQRVGALEITTVDVRVIAASNKNLAQMVHDHQFREDLYYRLNVFPIVVPPLRERKSDIPLLLDHFITNYTNTNGMIKPKLTPAAINFLSGYSWPGNIRQLQHFVERLLLIKRSSLIDLDAVRPLLEAGDPIKSTIVSENKTLHEASAQFERDYIISVLQANNWRVAKAAEILGEDRANLYRKMKRLGINFSS